MTLYNAKQATVIAKKYFEELTGINEVYLEEVELSEDEKYWFITLGYYEPIVGVLANLARRKNYKVFKVSTKDGQVISMKIRQVITE
jgi:hypothetical protein